MSCILAVLVSMHVFGHQLTVYETLDAYKNNKPSETITAQIFKRVPHKKKAPNDANYMMETDVKKDIKNLRKKYWIVSSGNYSYINCRKTIGLGYYARVLYKDDNIIYYKAGASASTQATVAIFTGAIGLIFVALHRFDYVTYLTDGYTMELNENNLKSLLKRKNKELLEHYYDEEHPRDSEVMLKYIKLLNNTN